MANLYRAESTNDDPRIGGIVFQFDDHLTKVVSWRHGAPVPVDQLATWAKEIATNLVQHLLETGREDAIRNTNWASMVAAILKHITDWNGELRESLLGSSSSEPPKVH